MDDARAWLGLAPIGALAVVLTSGCTSDGSAGPGARVGDELLLTNSLSGEECRVRNTPASPGATQLERFEINCAGWQEPSGFVWRMPEVGKTNLSAMLVDKDLPLWQINAVACGDLEAAGDSGDAPTLIRRCTSAEGWPYFLIGAEDPDNHWSYVGWGLPHVAPVFERFVAIEGGRGDPVALRRGGTRSELVLLAEQEVSSAKGDLSLSDIHDYADFTRLGNLYNQIGDFAGAESAHRRALQIQERFLGPNHPALGITMAAIALNMSNLGASEDARRLFDRAEPLVRQSSVDHRSRYLAYRGLFAAKYESPERGLEYVRQARTLRLQRFGQESPEVAYSYFLEGTLLDQVGQHQAAVDTFGQALPIFRQVRDPIWSAFTYEWLADSYRKLGKYQTAEDYAQRAIKTIGVVFGDGVRLAQALTKLGEVQRDAGRTGDALATFERAVSIAVRDQVASQYLEIADVTPDLDLLLQEAQRRPDAAQNLLAKALIAAQAPKDRTTSKAIQLMAARLAERDPAIRLLARELQDKRAALQSARFELGREQLLDEAERDRQREADLAERVRLLSAEAATQERRLQAKFPNYGGLISSAAVPANEVSAQLQPGEAVVDLLVAPDATYAFLIDARGQIRAHKADLGADQLEHLVLQLREGLDPSRGLRPFDLQLAHQLYTRLLGPFDAELGAVQHVIFVLTGPLLSLPPAVLVRKDPGDSRDYRNAAWLVRDLAISVLPSLGALRELRAVVGASAAREPFLGVGDPSFGGAAGDSRALLAAANQCREDELFDPSILRRAPPLPETRVELLLIADSLAATSQSLMFGAAASETKIRALDLSRYRVIAFATHGLLPNELRCQSEPALVLTPPAAASPADDGLLTASEIAQLRLDADWVVLSACNTAGPGGELGGESLSGLARAFFYAGARALLVSHWPVNSKPTVALTTGTFERYAKSGNQGKAEALRQAELALISQPPTAHPARWAPFVLVGDGGPHVALAAGPSSWRDQARPRT